MRRALPAAVAVLIATALRLVGLPGLFVDGRPRLISGDSWYHLRRMAFVADGTGLPDVDYWTHHPKGMVPHWPPLLDIAGGWLAWAAGGGSTDLDRVALAGMALLALIAAATFALVWWMAAHRTNAFGGALAVLVLAFLPIHHNYTRVGKVDHHALEPLATFFALEAMLRACATPGRAAWGWVVAAAAGMVALIASLPSSSLDVSLLAAAAGFRLLLGGAEASDRRRLGLALAGAFALAGLLGMPVAWTSPMTRTGQVVSFNLSLLQPAMLLACAAGLGVAALTPGSRWLALATGAAVGAGLLLVWPAGRTALLGGSQFVTAEGFVGIIDESNGVAQLGWGFAFAFLSRAIVLVPAFVWWAVRRDDVDLRVLVAMLAVTTVLALVQFRFGLLMSVPVAVVTGMAGASLVGAARSGSRRWWALAGLASASLLLFAPALAPVTSQPFQVAQRLPVWRALEWLRHHSPRPGDPWQPGSRPEWAVLAPWNIGHEVLVVGDRANVASPFIAPGETDGLGDALRFYLARSPADAAAILERRGARWVITLPVPPVTLARYARAVGDDPARLIPAATAAAALHDRHGSATADFPQAWDFLRLAHVGERGEAKLFERVAGARIEGRGAEPKGEVLLRVDLDVAGAAARWFAVTRADARGRFEVRTPYASEPLPGSNVRVSQILLRTDGRVLDLQVPGAAVTNGDTVVVDAGA